MAGRTAGALSDLTVVELATGVAGPYCGRLLRDLGATVLKVEPRAGDRLRGEYPFVGGESAFFGWLNAGKRGLVMEPGDPKVVELAEGAEIVIHDLRGAEADALELRLTAEYPGLVVVSITPYGRSGPRASWATSPLTEYATSGYHYIAGDPEREPLALPGHQVEFHAGMHATAGALAALWHARETQQGQVVEVSHQEAALSDHSWLTTSWTHQGLVQRRAGSLYAKCADGYIYLFNLVPYPNLFVLMERFDLLEDETLQDPMTWWGRFGEVFAAFSEWAATRTRDEIFRAAQELRIAVSPVYTMADLATSEQLAAREWLREIEVGGQRVRAPGFPFKLMGTPCENDGRAPLLGEHDGWEAPARTGGSSARPVEIRPRRVGPAPLEGLRVIEVTANWAGPIGGRHLADLGAEVIKLELATKPATRTLAYVGDDVTWPRHYDRAGYFNKLNRNKKAVCLDLSTAAGRSVFLRMVGEADVVLENNAARVMGQLGLSYEALREEHPGIVMCSMSGFGGTGPQKDYSAYGSNIETLSGLASLLGYGPDEFFGTGTFYADPVTGGHGAVAILAALHARRRTGEGQWIDMSLLEAVGPFFAQQFLEYALSGKPPVPMGNRHPVHSPQNIYRTAGNDCWLALTVRNEREFGALCRAIGAPELADDAKMGTAENRRESEGRVGAAISAWAATLDHNAAARALQAVGVPAAPVMANWEIFTDNHLNDREFFARIRHPEAGTISYPGFPWRFSGTPLPEPVHAPMFGEHNREVFTEMAGLGEAEVAALYDEGVTSDSPIYASGPSL